jgi:hypothetical protein
MPAMNFEHDQNQEHKTRAGRLAHVEELRATAEAEQELAQLLKPLARRNAGPELRARLQRTLRETHKTLAHEETRSWLGRWFARRLLIPVPLVAAALTLIVGLGSWVAVLEMEGGPAPLHGAAATMQSAAAGIAAGGAAQANGASRAGGLLPRAATSLGLGAALTLPATAATSATTQTMGHKGD